MNQIFSTLRRWNKIQFCHAVCNQYIHMYCEKNMLIIYEFYSRRYAFVLEEDADAEEEDAHG